MIRNKVAAAARNDISPILCIGETNQEHEAHETKRVIHDQLTTALSDVTSEDMNKVVVAYEPAWAISTFQGKLAKPSEIEPIIKYIRSQISELYGDSAGVAVRVLYGGSVETQTASGYLMMDGCNGVLVGGESLHFAKFCDIVESAERVYLEKLKQEQHHE
jgi:triosephosphate isomerase